MKKKNIKIKHRKYSLYQRKKSKGRKFLTGLLMVILVAGLCVLGYGLGKPLVEYFSNRGNEPPPESAWTPPVPRCIRRWALTCLRLPLRKELRKRPLNPPNLPPSRKSKRRSARSFCRRPPRSAPRASTAPSQPQRTAAAPTSR